MVTRPPSSRSCRVPSCKLDILAVHVFIATQQWACIHTSVIHELIQVGKRRFQVIKAAAFASDPDYTL